MDDKDKNKLNISEEDQKLWNYVSETITPLHPNALITFSEQDIKPLNHDSHDRVTSSFTSTTIDTQPLTPIPHQQTSNTVNAPKSNAIDRRTLNRLKKGKIQIDRTLDMHGMTQDTAHNALRRTLLAAHRDDLRLVLVITGKGAQGEGILRRRLKEWCELPPLDDIVLQIHASRPQHGGGGAFYVYLRRRR